MNFKEDKSIAAIPTRYKGYHFRSRLEARWAVFFDALGIKWEYEVQGYDLGKFGWYLPDFTITTPFGQKYIYEVKPGNERDLLAEEKLKQLTKTGSVLYGDPYEMLIKPDGELMMCPRCGAIGESFEAGRYEEKSSFGCWVCDFETPSIGDVEERVLFSKAFIINHTKAQS